MRILKCKYSWLSEGDIRIDAAFHLSDGRVTRTTLENSPLGNTRLGDFAHEIFYGGRSRRIYVDNELVGIPFMGSADMLKPDFNSLKFVSRKVTKNLERYLLSKGWILISRSGTIGNTRYASEDFEDKAASEHIIRINPNDNIKSGYLYSFLTSKFGYALLTQGTFGAVIQHIEPDYLAELPIPNISEDKQLEMHRLIVDASELRVTANKLIYEADQLFHSLNEIEYSDYHTATSENQKYFGFRHKINENATISIKAKNHSKRVLEIQELWKTKNGTALQDYLVKRYRIGPRGSFKRIDSNTAGTEMVSQTDLHRTNPRNFKRVIVSRKNAEDLANDNQVLFPAVGNGSSEGEILFRPTLAYKSFSNRLLSGDIGRFECASINHAAYLFTALRSKGGFRMMRAFYYGTQLRRPLWELLKNINIPIKDNDCFIQISEKVIEAYKLRFKADAKENEAVGIIEKEIESWQK